MHTILIVDDNAGFRLRRARSSRRTASGRRRAADGTSGLAAARALRPQLVLLDIGLPDVEASMSRRRSLSTGPRRSSS
jgi:DNA-binding response OmpR family regulator